MRQQVSLAGNPDIYVEILTGKESLDSISIAYLRRKGIDNLRNRDILRQPIHRKKIVPK
jgi:hypothetical protein